MNSGNELILNIRIALSRFARVFECCLVNAGLKKTVYLFYQLFGKLSHLGVCGGCSSQSFLWRD